MLTRRRFQKCTACTKTKHRVHGAPIQCTKGKCPKAFHVSCAREGHASGIVYKVVREVEKEVVLLDSPTLVPPPPPPPPILLLHPHTVQEHGNEQAQPMQVDPTTPAPLSSGSQVETLELQASPSPQVLKTIKKMEVEVLCHQHNPVGPFFGRLEGIPSLKMALRRRSSRRRRRSSRIESRTRSWPFLRCPVSRCV